MKKKLFFMLVATTVMILGSSMTVLAKDSTDPLAIPSSSSFPLPTYDGTNESTMTIYASPAPSSSPSGTGNETSDSLTPSTKPHAHNYEWKATIEPTESKDGLSQYMCGCGEVADSQPIAAGHAYVEGIFDQIENAPENSTVVVSPGEYRCYTAKVMEMLKKRPDIILKTVYTDKDGTEKSFSITAADIEEETAMFYGFTYLGNTYGWD